METRTVQVGDVLIGSRENIVIQTMCNTHTNEVEATVEQCRRMAAAGAQLIRITVPSVADVEHIRAIRAQLRAEGITTPLVADIHFSSATALAVAPHVEKVRINPGNFHRDHDEARRQFLELLDVCKQHGTAIRIGLNHGSLGEYITNLYGNTPLAMAKAAMEWVDMCIERKFYQVVVSLKASNTLVVVEAYRLLAQFMQERGVVFPLHVGVTEAGNGDSGRIKSCVGISTLLAEGLGNTIRVSLTEDPVNELPVARYLADRYDHRLYSSLTNLKLEGKKAVATYEAEYVACPGCGRTMYDLQAAFEAVKARTSHLKNVVIAVMGCIVNGPGEMADADWGYVGEGNHKVSIYKGKTPVLRHIPDTEAIDRLLELIESDAKEA